MVKWSPSLMGHKPRRSTLKLRQLYPPFLQREYKDRRKWIGIPIEEIDVDSSRRSKRKLKSSIAFSISESPEERFAEFKDDQQRDSYDQDYQWWEDDFEEEETDSAEEKRETESLWSLEGCKTYSILSKPDEEPDTTDPYLSHDLYLPYSLTPRPRNFIVTDAEHGYEATALPRRPRSPVRTLLPGKFDLSASCEEQYKYRRMTETKERLNEAKERISQSIRQLPFDWSNVDLLISSLVLQAVCEEVTMTLMNVRLDTDIHTLVNAAIVLALRDMDVFGYEILVDEEFLLLSYFRFANFEYKLAASNILNPSGTRKMLLSAFRAPFSRSHWTTLHRRVQWSYLSPTHEKGHTKFYPNIHERINEALPKEEASVVVSSYVSDLTCYHTGDISDKTHVAYKRKSKFADEVTTPAQMTHTVLMDIVNF